MQKILYPTSMTRRSGTSQILPRQHCAKEGDATGMATEVLDRCIDSIPGAPVVHEDAVENESFPTGVSPYCGRRSAPLLKMRQDWHQLSGNNYPFAMTIIDCRW